jgi:MFS family permease
MPQRYRVLVAVAIGYLSIMLAVSPISAAMPTIASSLGIDVEEAGWIMVSYLLILTACLLPAGRLGDLVGHKQVFLVGLVLATVAAALVGLVDQLWMILALRGLQGAGAALISGNVLAILTAAFSARERGRVVGFATVSASLGAGGGTLLAPLVLDLFGWRGVFLLVVPVGLLSLALSAGMPEPPRPHRARRGVDVPGAILLFAALLMLSLSFNHFHEGEETFEAGWPYHTATQLMALALFVWVERRSREPLVRLEYLRHVPFAAAVAANGVFHMTMMATFFLTPFLFENAWGLTNVHTSTMIGLLQGITLATAVVAGWVVDRTRWSFLPALALGGIATGLLALGLLGDALTYATFVVVAVLLGVSSGFFNTSNNTVIMSVLPDEARGFASGMLETTRQLGHSVAVSIGTAALGLAGATLRGDGGPEAMFRGFQLAVLIMGGIAAAGVVLAHAGRGGRGKGKRTGRRAQKTSEVSTTPPSAAATAAGP